MRNKGQIVGRLTRFLIIAAVELVQCAGLVGISFGAASLAFPRAGAVTPVAAGAVLYALWVAVRASQFE